MPTKSPKNTTEKNILRITVRLACLPPAIHSPSDTDNKDKHNGIILMSLFSKEQHWQCDGNVQLAAVLSPPPFPVPSLPNFSSDRCAVQAMSGCVLPSPLCLLLRDGFLVIFSSLSHPRMLGRQTPRWLSLSRVHVSQVYKGPVAWLGSHQENTVTEWDATPVMMLHCVRFHLASRFTADLFAVLMEQMVILGSLRGLLVTEGSLKLLVRSWGLGHKEKILQTTWMSLETDPSPIWLLAKNIPWPIITAVFCNTTQKAHPASCSDPCPSETMC